MSMGIVLIVRMRILYIALCDIYQLWSKVLEIIVVIVVVAINDIDIDR